MNVAMQYDQEYTYLILKFQQGRQKAGRIKTGPKESPKSRRKKEILQCLLRVEGEKAKSHMFQVLKREAEVLVF